MKYLQSSIAALCVCTLLVPSGFAEDAQTSSTGAPAGTPAVLESRWYTPFTRKYTMHELPPINLTNSPRLESLVRAGRVYLSLQDAIALALENNLDIDVQRYGRQIAEANLLRAKAGGLIRGVLTPVSNGPSSASATSQLSGGGSTGAVTPSATTSTGASSGTIITSTGTAIPNFDEVLSTSYFYNHRSQINSNSFSTGVPASIFDTNSFNMAVQRGWATGTTATLSFGSQGLTSNNVRSEINPVTTGNAQVLITQRLLQGFGPAVNTRNIRIAQNSIGLSDLQFKAQVIQTVSSVVNLYSDLVSFNEDVKVKRQALTLNEKLYNDNKKQVEIGTLAPIEIVRAEAEVARSQQDLTQSETRLLQQETIIKNFLSRTGVSSPTLSEARVIPTDQLKIPDVEPVQPIQDLVEKALINRPEIAQTRINLENSKIQLLGSKSQLLPSLDFIVGATNNGLAGQPNTIPFPSNVPAFTRNADPTFVGGWGTLFSQLFGRNYPDYSVGFQLNIPLRNRSAQADVANDQLNLRQAEVRERQQINQVRVDVQNALIGVQQSRAQYQAAVKSRILQEQTLDAEQKKYALGASTIFFVIQAQRDLAQAQATEVAALSAYNRARVTLDQATGLTLETYGVSLEEARSGKVAHAPSTVPAVEK